ncbi:MAG: GDP-mannose 4,6-dehydratase [bacterium]|nr:GDP-mannose 4,6-dehydratase [bacterium]
MKIRKIVVIGSNSFFGSHFVEQVLITTDWKVIGISRSPEYASIFLPYLYKKQRSKKFQFKRVDVNKDYKKLTAFLDKEKPEVVVNFAAQGFVPGSWKNPEDYFETNCASVVRLTDHLRKKDYLKKYIQISTPEVYGPCRNLKETITYYNPTTPYGASRGAADLFLTALFQTVKFPVSFVRAANIYGPHQQTYRIIPSAIILLKKKKKVVLWSGGVQRNFIHVTDASKGILKVILKGKPGAVYHLTAGKNISIFKLIKTICAKMRVPCKDVVNNSSVTNDESLKRDQIYHLDGRQTEKSLDWKATIALSDGLDETIQWVEECWSELKDDSLKYIYKK